MVKNNLIKNQMARKRRAEQFLMQQKREAPVVKLTADEATCYKCELYVYCGKKNPPKPTEFNEAGNPVCYSLPAGIYDSVNK